MAVDLRAFLLLSLTHVFIRERNLMYAHIATRDLAIPLISSCIYEFTLARSHMNVSSVANDLDKFLVFVHTQLLTLVRSRTHVHNALRDLVSLAL